MRFKGWMMLFVLALGVTPAWSAPKAAPDGEGTATLNAKQVVAGSQTTLIVEFTVGPGGIPVGGGISLGLHHAADWGPIQFTAPNRPGYTKVEGATRDNFELTWYQWIPKEMVARQASSASADSMFHQCLVAKVKKQALKPGEHVRIILGANPKGIMVHPYADRHHQFRIMIDGNADGVYQGIAKSPIFDIVAGPATRLLAIQPATLVAGRPFELQLRAEDRFCNLADTYEGKVDVLDRAGKVLAAQIPLEKGLKVITLTLAKPGPYCLRLSDGKLAGRANPCRVFKKDPPFHVWFGDIHGHTDDSDGLADSAAAYFAFARDIARLDVAATADHAYHDWPGHQKAVREFYQPGRFVTILGFEGGASVDHMNIYYKRDDMEPYKGWATTVPQFYQFIRNTYDISKKEVIVGPHHFTYPRGDDRYPMDLVAQNEDVNRFVEVYSCHGASEYLGNPRPLHGASAVQKDKFLQAGLAKGCKFGVIGSGDDHSGHPGHAFRENGYSNGLVAFLAKDLTRESIWDAFWNYHVYATSFERIYIEFTINGQIMGSSLKSQAPLKIQYYIIGQDDNLSVVLLRDNQEIRRDKTKSGVVEVKFSDSPASGDHFYYLRVEQKNGERAWSTPIWVSTK
jgi:hypothetical protein